MSTKKKTVEVDIDILKKCYLVFNNFGRPKNSNTIQDYTEGLHTLKYYVEQDPKTTIEPPTEKLYSLDLLHQLVTSYFDSDYKKSDLKKALETFEYENKRSKAIAEFIKEYDAKHNYNG